MNKGLNNLFTDANLPSCITSAATSADLDGSQARSEGERRRK